jgi:hypothetical protein
VKTILENFCIFILSHKRSDNMPTYELLKRFNYDGPLFILIDSDDPTSSEYFKRFPSIVILIDVDKSKSDSFDNFGKHAVLHARNSCFDVARKLGYEYFLQLDDDYTGFGFRFPRELEDKGTKYGDAKWDWIQSKATFNEVLSSTLRLFVKTNATSLAFSQGGDWLSAKGPVFSMRKCMNSFFCSTNRYFNFIGRANEDVNTYVLLGGRGYLFLTIPHFQVCQRTTQKHSGGTTDVYLNEGTYVKSFYSILCSPSCVKIQIMGSANRRLHHRINWDAAVPVIVDERYCKQAKLVAPKLKALPMVTLPSKESVTNGNAPKKTLPPPKKKEIKPEKKFDIDNYWKDRGFCGSIKLTDSVTI